MERDLDLKRAVETLEKGGTILYPTDTIWGIGCDPSNDNAIKKIFKIKRREDNHQMLVLIDEEANISNYADNVPDIALNLIREAKKPLSVIFQNARNLSPSLTGRDNTIGIRVVRDAFCQELIRSFGKPVISTSANISGNPAPVSFDQIAPEILDAVDYAVTWRRNDPASSTPSDIIKIGTDGEVIKIR